MIYIKKCPICLDKFQTTQPRIMVCSELCYFTCKMEKFPENPDSCWIWGGNIKWSKGYGAFNWNGEKRLAHVVSFDLFKGGKTNGMEIRHSCHNRACVNPRHLSLGTHAENMKDMTEAKRSAHGVFNGGCKIAESDALEIRSKSGTQQSIADLYGISQVQVSRIKRGKSWKYITH